MSNDEQVHRLLLDGAGDSEIIRSTGVTEGELRSAKRVLDAGRRVVTSDSNFRRLFEESIEKLVAEQQDYIDRLNNLIGMAGNPDQEARLLKAREQARITQARIYAGFGGGGSKRQG